jgi:uncharacterized NAD-dependent epimerase/dehydratase family protein
VRESAIKLEPKGTPLVVLSEGCFGESQSKFALGIIRYGNWPIAAVIDSTKTGKTVQEITNLPCQAPIVSSLKETLPFQPKALLIGTAPPGGQLPPDWRAVLTEAIQNGLHIINGLHFFLTEEPDLMALAQQHHVMLWDVRDPESYGRHKFQVINTQKPRPENLQVVTMVGTDCSVGKMHTALELHAQTQKRGLSSAFLATGQTGILIHGSGVPLDRVIGDFMAGSLEVCIQEEISRFGNSGKPSVIFVEGQGALQHPAYSGVTLSLLHGSNPDAMILCHKANTQAIRNYPQVPLAPMNEIIAMYESAAFWVRQNDKPKAKVIGISVNTSMLDEPDAQQYLTQLCDETGLPVTDPVRYGVGDLLDALNLNASQVMGVRS